MSSEKTCISPDILEEVNEFWEMCGRSDSSNVACKGCNL
jgi:hypothetical protein